MAKKSELKERGTGEILYPITHEKCVVTDDGRGIASKQYADDAAAAILNSTPEQLAVINELGEQLANDDNLANAVTKTVSEAKKQLFIDMWNEACKTSLDSTTIPSIPVGKYNQETGYFELNGLTDITYEEAIGIYSVYSLTSTAYTNKEAQFQRMKFRTLFPIHTEIYPTLSYNMKNLCCEMLFLEVVSFVTRSSYRYVNINNGNRMFYSCKSLRRVLTPIVVSSVSDANNYPWLDGCQQLEELKIFGISKSYSQFKNTPKLNLESFQYLIANAANTVPITITVHDDVYAKLTDTGNTEWYQVMQDAQAKQITFATA